MSVRPILLQKDGAIKGIPGTYRNSPPPIAGMYTGSGALINVSYYTVNASGEAELKTVKAYPFYVDSVSGGLDTSGDGTPGSPWRSVNYALAQIQPILTCLSLKSCCTYIVLRVKGMLDYTVRYNNGAVFNGYNRFIIEPWTIDNITINSSNQNTCLNNLRYSIFKNIEARIEDNSYIVGKSIILIKNCYASVFNDCSSFMNLDSVSAVSSSGFELNNNSIFYKCNGSHFLNGDSSSTTVFAGNDGSIFYESSGECNGYHWIQVNSFWGNRYSAFYKCSGMVYGDGNGCGFYQNYYSSYIDCIGNSIGGLTCDL